MKYIVNTFKHLGLVIVHRWEVFKLCCKIGLVWRGLVHDLSKFSPTEFWESVKYYDGKVSPVKICKMKQEYSKAWLHHKGRNKHHPEYWYDDSIREKTIIMPFKYACEMVCDQLAAGKTYQGKNWTNDYQLQYFNRIKDHTQINEKIKNFLEEVYIEVSKDGINKVITKKNLKKIYDKHVNNK